MPTPIIVSFEGTPARQKSGEQHEESLQILRGGAVHLSWKTRDAEGVELTDSSNGKVEKLAAQGQTMVTPENEVTDYTLVAFSASERSDAERVHVSTHEAGDVLSHHAELESPIETSEDLGGDGGLTSLIVSKGAAKSRSFSPKDEQPFASMKNAEQRFCFAPGVDEVTVAWTTRGATPAVTLELYRQGSDRPVWTRKLKPKRVKKLEFKWKGDFSKGELLEPEAFPHGLMTAEHAPYLLKAIAPRSAEKERCERWTYLDVRVQRLDLSWSKSPAQMIPVGKDERAKHAAVYKLLTDISDDKNLKGRLPAPDEEKKIYLKTNQFFQGDGDLTGERNTFFNWLHKLWGNGPKIPIVVSAKLRDAEGKPVDAPKALGKARFLWDYEDKSSPPAAAEEKIKDFVARVADHEAAASADAPKGTNAHVIYGGKRGKGGAPIFPEHPGLPATDDLPPVNDQAPAFPFKVTRCAKRKWAAISEAWSDGALAASSGVVFEPSRMAGDAYAIHVYYVAGSEEDAVQLAREPDRAPAELHASTGTMTVWHDCDVVQYVQIGTGAKVVDIDKVVQMVARQYVRLGYDTSKRVDGTAKFKEGMKEIYQANGRLRRQLADYVRAGLPTIPDPNLKSMIQFNSWEIFRKTWIAANNGDLAATYKRSLEIENPINEGGGEKFDWHGREGTGFPLMQPPPIDHSKEVAADHQGFVLVDFTNPRDPKMTSARQYKVVFEEKGRKLRWLLGIKNTSLSPKDIQSLVAIYHNCLRAPTGRFEPYKPGDEPIRVTLTGKTTKEGNQQRLKEIREALDTIVELYGSSETPHTGSYDYPKGPGDEFPVITESGVTGLCRNGTKYQYQAGYEWVWNIIELVLADKFPSASGGLYILQVAGVDISNFKSPNAKAMYASNGGKSLTIVLSPNAAWPTLGHEVGHAKFVNHTNDTDNWNDPLNLHHVEKGQSPCIMPKTNAAEVHTFCGLCMLRMRGWSIFEVTDAAAATYSEKQILKHDMA